MTTANVPQPRIQDHEHFMATLGTVARCAREKFPEHGERIDKAVQLVIDGRVILHDDGTATVRSQTKPDVQYHVNGRCECPDTADWCKHRLSAGILKRVTQRLAEVDAAAQCWQPVDADGTPCYLVAGECPHEAAAPALLAPYIVSIHGKPFIKYAGLLALAHQKGLQSLTVRLISILDGCAIVEATATFADGRTFTDIGDATASNVGAQVKPHYIRVASCRAKARALRDGLNVSMCSVEEIE